MTEIFPGSLQYADKTVHNVVMCFAICFVWTFLGLAAKPHSYYVGNIKGWCSHQSWSGERGRFVTYPPISFHLPTENMHVEYLCVWVELVSLSVLPNDVRLGCSGPSFNQVSSHPFSNSFQEWLTASPNQTVINNVSVLLLFIWSPTD